MNLIPIKLIYKDGSKEGYDTTVDAVPRVGETVILLDGMSAKVIEIRHDYSCSRYVVKVILEDV